MELKWILVIPAHYRASSVVAPFLSAGTATAWARSKNLTDAEPFEITLPHEYQPEEGQG